MLLADVLLARSLAPSEFGEYMLVRNSLPLVSVVTLLGVDQAVTRRYAEGDAAGLAAGVFRLRALVAVAAAAGTAALLHALIGATPLTACVAGIAGIAVAGSDLAAAHLRGKGSYHYSAFTQQGHRLLWGLAIVALVLLLPSSTQLTAALAVVPVVAFILTGIGIARGRPFSERGDADVRSASRLGLAFGASMLSLMLLDWLDQALLAQSSGLASSGIYASQRLVAVYPLLSLASIAGFVLMPELIRRASSLTPELVRRGSVLAAAGCGVLGIAWSILAVPVFGVLMPREANPTVMVCLAIVGALRLFYLLPSSLLGAFGSTGLILRTSLVAMVAPVALTMVFLLVAQHVQAEEAMAISLVVATAIRVGIATGAAQVALKRWRAT